MNLWNLTLAVPLGALPAEMQLMDALAQIGARLIRAGRFVPVATIEAASGADVLRLLRVDGVVTIERDSAAQAQPVRVRAALNPDYSWPIELIGGVSAHERTQGGGIIVAVLDTGIDLSHREFAGAAILGAESALEGKDPSDLANHGTTVCGIMVAQGVQMLGICPAAGLYSISVLAANGLGAASTVIAGIDRALELGAQVINMSFRFLENARPGSVDAALEAATDAGVLLVAASGNESQREILPSPAHSPHTIAVGAIGRNGRVPGWSNSAPWPLGVDTVAPGDNVPGPVVGGGYSLLAGTSYAAPLVSGALALALAVHPEISAPGQTAMDPKFGVVLPSTVVSVRNQLLAHSHPIQDGLDIAGYGLIDAAPMASARPTEPIFQDQVNDQVNRSGAPVSVALLAAGAAVAAIYWGGEKRTRRGRRQR